MYHAHNANRHFWTWTRRQGLVAFQIHLKYAQAANSAHASYLWSSHILGGVLLYHTVERGTCDFQLRCLCQPDYSRVRFLWEEYRYLPSGIADRNRLHCPPPLPYLLTSPYLIVGLYKPGPIYSLRAVLMQSYRVCSYKRYHIWL